jgi:iron complex transport system ATP-binding protein
VAAVTLSVENGCFTYGKDSRQILKSVCFSAGSGDLAAILGPNGAGKTTLLRCMMGFLPWQSGRSALDGRDIRALPYRELWRHVAYVPQARTTVTSYTVEEMALLGRSSRFGAFAQPGRADVETVRAVLRRLGIDRLREKKCSQISGGELQMVLIARALAAEPEILVLDEPESNLDFRNQLLIMDTLSELAAQGMTCIFNTHYPAHAMQRANKALLLGADGNYLFGGVREVVTERNIERAFGVKAVIGEIETPGSVIRDVLPLRVSAQAGALEPEPGSGARCLAIVSVIAASNEMARRINALLHAYNRFIIGRMGMPYPDGGVYMITVTFDAPEGEIRELVAALSRLPGVDVKATYAAGAFQNRSEERIHE